MVGSSREFFEKKFANLDQTRVTSKRIGAIGKTALDVKDTAQSIADKAASNRHLNDDGKRAARQEALFGHFVDNAKAARQLDDLASKVNSDLTALALPELDKTDVGAAMRDQEARSIVRAMPQEKRDALDRLPPALAAAVVRVPPELSGVSPTVHKMIRDQLVETMHPDKVVGARGDLQGIEFARHTVKEAHAALRTAAQLAPHEASDFLKRVKAAATPKEKPPVDPEMDLDALIAARRHRSVA